MKKRVIITGGTGLIGSYLTKRLISDYELILLTRSPQKYKETQSIGYVYWDGESLIPGILEGAYAIINLTGENIGSKRWTSAQKELILRSRSNAAKAIKESIDQCKHKPEVWIQASATGFYGQGSDTILNEYSPKGNSSFLADVCLEWEHPIDELDNPSVRKVIIRTGVVLAKNSDLWKQLTLPFFFKVAVTVGDGSQHLPWIHIDDEVEAIYTILANNDYKGVFNLVSPEDTTMQKLIGEINRKESALISLKLPAWLLSLVFGKEKTNELVLTDQQVYPTRLVETGFRFKYSSIREAVNSLI